jgi:signal transduction histidine kinase
MARRAKPGVPFVVVSGKVGEEAALEAMRAGAHDYVMKGNLARLCATVERGLEEAEERRGRKRVEEELRDSAAEMRALIFELRPESLENEGLVAALEKQAAALEARHGLEVKPELCDEPDAPLETKGALYRIAQEALHNIVKHARARSVNMNLAYDPERVTLEISDDGVGFDRGGDFPGHLGLHSMRERAEGLDGTLEVESSPGSGTRIRAEIPI